jgi:hypothetical protein
MNIGFKELAELDPEGRFVVAPEYPTLFYDTKRDTTETLEGVLRLLLNEPAALPLHQRVEAKVEAIRGQQ